LQQKNQIINTAVYLGSFIIKAYESKDFCWQASTLKDLKNHMVNHEHCMQFA